MTVKWPERPSARSIPARRHAAPRSVRRIAPELAALALIALLVPLRGSWAAQLALVPLLLIVPGAILLRALRIPSRAISAYPAFVPCASLVVLLASGLAVDLIGLGVGMAAPLRAGPLLAGLEVICLALLLSSTSTGLEVGIRWAFPQRPIVLAWPFILPLTAAAGALRLNSGHGNSIALTALCVCVLAIVSSLALARRLDTSLLVVILYAAGLAMMWSYSLRGDLVYGFDIADEYYSLQQTVLSGAWHPAHIGDAYGAMLSVTVLPSEFHALSGLPALLVLKVVYPVIGALIPVMVFSLARRIVNPTWAFAAAALLVVQPAFSQELPGLARQEIAMLLFAALVAAALDSGRPRPPQLALIALFGLAVAVSHYSTAYMVIALFGLMLVLQWLTSWLRNIPRVSVTAAVGFLTVLIAAFLWYGPITHSAANLIEVADTLRSQGLDLLPSQGTGKGLLSAYLQNGGPATISAQRYAELAHSYYASHKLYITPLPDAGSPLYALHNATPSVPPIRWRLGYDTISLGTLVVAQLVNVIAAIGALTLVLRRRTPVVARQVGIMCLATLVILTVIRLSATAAIVYNPERAFLQGLIILAISLCWLLELLAGRRRRLQLGVLAVAASCLAVFFISGSGLDGALQGGGTAINLANSGDDFERYDMTTAELASASWLGQVVWPGQLVYADRYGQLRVMAMTSIRGALVLDITPLTLDQHAWVYASHTNITDGRAATIFDNQFVSYAFPVSFLESNYNTVYTNGSSEVFHR